MTRYLIILLISFCWVVCTTPQPKGTNPAQTYETKLQVAATASKNGEWLKAAKLYEQLYLEASSKEALNYETGTNYLRANHPHKALTILTNFDQQYQDPTVDFNGRIARIAKAYYQIGAFQKIEELVKQYEYPKMYRGLAREHIKALIQLNKLKELSTYFARYQQTGIYDDKGKKTNAGFLYRAICNELLLVGQSEVLRQYADDYRIWATKRLTKDKRNLAYAIFYQQEEDQAIPALQEAIVNEKSPRHIMELEGLLGVCYANNREQLKANRQVQKIQNMDKLPARHDAFGAPFYHQARIEVALDQPEKAIQSLKKAIATKAAFWSNRFKEDGLLKDLFERSDFKGLVKTLE